MEHQLTTSSATVSQALADVSGNTIVYTEFSPSGSDVKGCTIGGACFDVAGDETSTNPVISGSLVAWEDVSTVNDEIHARDLSTGVVKTLTNNPGNNTTGPNVDGRNVVYSTQTATGCQVSITNFDTTLTRKLAADGCNSSADISGDFVVYQAVRAGEQHVFVYQLATGTETEILPSGLQRNPHISGNWVSFEDVNTTSGASSVDLYYIPTGQVFTAAAATSPLTLDFSMT